MTVGDAYSQEAVEEAVRMTRAQFEKPDVYNDTTLETLAKMSALAAFFRQKAAEASVAGDRKTSGYYKGHVEALQLVIDSLKYKINAATGKR